MATVCGGYVLVRVRKVKPRAGMIEAGADVADAGNRDVVKRERLLCCGALQQRVDLRAQRLP
ncbi:MAG TPA: hypothetical protein PK916_01150 [Bacteroidota bacterium]|nr:hypothetical protein [Bacteroidota bacterium]